MYLFSLVFRHTLRYISYSFFGSDFVLVLWLVIDERLLVPTVYTGLIDRSSWSV